MPASHPKGGVALSEQELMAVCDSVTSQEEGSGWGESPTVGTRVPVTMALPQLRSW